MVEACSAITPQRPDYKAVSVSSSSREKMMQTIVSNYCGDGDCVSNEAWAGIVCGLGDRRYECDDLYAKVSRKEAQCGAGIGDGSEPGKGEIFGEGEFDAGGTRDALTATDAAEQVA